MEDHNFTKEEIIRLVLASLGRDITPGEQDALNKWLRESEDNEELYRRLVKEGYIQENLDQYRRYDSREGWKKVAPTSRGRLFRWLPYVAGVVILLSGAWLTREAWSQWFTLHPTIASSEVIVGSSKARLITETGAVVVLGKQRVDTVPTLLDRILTDDGVQLVYKDTSVNEPVQWHTMEIPRGGEYKLVLADGSRVTLNAESTIHYPSRFEGEERRIEFSGEAFFEIVSDAEHPFVVSSEGMRVEVMGTSFNLTSYPEEQQRMTLVSGRVGVTCDQQTRALRPGEQLIRDGEQVQVRSVNIYPYISWKSQRFIFEDELLEEVLRKLERWYDVRVVIRDPSVKKIRYTGNLPKYENIDNVLSLLELAARVNFDLEGRTLVVRED